MRFLARLLGRPLATSEAQDERIGATAGVPVLGLDAIASASYGPEAALTAMMAAGAAAPHALGGMVAGYLLLLAGLSFSYWQTIAAFPDGGGAYTVARRNLGERAGLVAAAALCTDYVLNVAVALSAGAGAIVSVVPALHPWTLTLTLGLLALLTIVNLRGVRAAGLAFRLPAYAYLTALGLVIGFGLVHAWLSGGSPGAAARVAPADPGTAVGVWLWLRAFAAGCTAMTGIEAVSNGVPLFREPRVRRARRSLAIISISLGLLLVGIALLVRVYGIQATPPGTPTYESVLSRIIRAVAGRGVVYDLGMASVLAVLALSANTSFADFPRVCRLLALDGYLPADFAHQGRRLVYADGILLLAGFAFVLLVAFGGVTDRLIPLFAVGAFLAFTMSQIGMAAGRREDGRHSRAATRLVSAAGAVLTSVALAIIVATKFADGAWLVVIVLPMLVWLFRRVRRHQDELTRLEEQPDPLRLDTLGSLAAVVPLTRLDRTAQSALRFAATIAPDVYAVQVLAEEPGVDDLGATWRTDVEPSARASGRRPPSLVVIRSPFREFYGPLLEWIDALAAREPGRTIAVVVPELVARRWYDVFVRGRPTLLKGLLALRGNPRIVVINVIAAPAEKGGRAIGAGDQP
jgi:amino acid transporter